MGRGGERGSLPGRGFPHLLQFSPQYNQKATSQTEYGRGHGAILRRDNENSEKAWPGL